MTAYEIRNHHCLLIPKECFFLMSFVVLRTESLRLQCASFFGLAKKLTLPQVMIKGFNLCEKKTPTS